MEKEQKIDRSLIYAKALAMVKVINNTDSMLRDIGLTLEFDDERKPIAKCMKVLFENPKEIVCEALGLELKTEEGYYQGMTGQLIPIVIDTYYPHNCDEDDFEFSISYEAMWDLIDKAADNLDCAKKVWSCFVNKDREAQEWLKKECQAIGWAENLDTQE